MKLTLNRTVFNDKCTLGEMLIDGVHFAYTLEDVCRFQNGDISKKIQNETCIDAGTYEVIVDFSNHFQKSLPHILNVPCFEGVRIHGGNTAADTEGCILIGKSSNWIDTISDCHDVVNQLTERIQNFEQFNIDTKVCLEITNVLKTA